MSDKELLIGEVENRPLRFAFAPKEGLVRLNDDGTIAERNVLGSFMAIDGGFETYQKFFSDNGFLFPVSSEDYTKIDAEDVGGIGIRMRVTLDLLNLLGAGKRRIDSDRNFPRLIHDCLSLVFDRESSITANGSSIYTTAKHPISGLLENPKKVQDKIDICARYKNKIDVKETDGTSYHMDREEWLKFANNEGENGDRDETYRNIVHLFINGDKLNHDLRVQLECLFHLYHDVGPIKSIENGLEFYENIDISNFAFEGKLKEKFIEMAKILVKEELDHNIKGVTPIYETSKMEPRWNVSSLLSAMYFSIFYLRPGVELMKPCANPNCGKYFKVSRTDSKKIYCSPECRNRMSQTNHRKRKNGN